ncbi:MAG TPA: hypothetical protein VNT52_17560, partial [Acidimicrobiales bacterium]|nr:hypothetical protein [Acidimicrobiales bacterium]
MTAQIGDVFYRFEDVWYAPPVDEFDNVVGAPTLRIQCQKLPVVKVTPKGVRLCNGVLVLNASRKKWACPSEALALESFKARKARQVEIHVKRAAR